MNYLLRQAARRCWPLLLVAALFLTGCTTSQVRTDKWLPDEPIVQVTTANERIRTRVVRDSLYLKATGLATTSVQPVERKHIEVELLLVGHPGFWDAIGQIGLHGLAEAIANCIG